jgi:hypothetical protein
MIQAHKATAQRIVHIIQKVRKTMALFCMMWEEFRANNICF